MPAGKDKFFGSHIILYKSLHKNLINCYRYFGPISAGYLVNIAFTTHMRLQFLCLIAIQ